MQTVNERQGSAYNPITHFVLTPILLVSLGAAIYFTARRLHENPVVYPWLIVLSAVLLLLNLQSRLYALRLQDRIIRLEETLRVGALAPNLAPTLGQELTTSQLIGLRFASDAELPTLARRATKEGLSQKAIKEAVGSWRRDDARV